MGTDFFDEDLLKQDRPARADASEKVEGPGPASSDLNLSRLTKHKKEVAGQVAGTVQAIESLKQKQDDLEQQKRRLEELARKQKEYEQGKRETMEALERSIVLLEKEELQANRRSELLSDMRVHFKESLAEIRGLDEDAWPEASFADELNRALVLIEESRLMHQKALAKVDAGDWMRGAGSGGSTAGEAYGATADGAAARGFRDWLLVGTAVSLPLAAVLVVLFVVYLVVAGFLR